MDDLEAVAHEHFEEICMLYDRFADRAPIMLLDVQEERIYAYPYADFQKELSERSQQLLREQYDLALREDQMVVFVRDNDQRRLVSFSWQR